MYTSLDSQPLESIELVKSSSKQPSTVPPRLKEENGATTYNYASKDPEQWWCSTYLQPSNSYENIVQRYGGDGFASYKSQQLPRRHSHVYPTPATVSPPSLITQSPQVKIWDSRFPALGSSTVRSLGLSSNVDSQFLPSSYLHNFYQKTVL